MAATLVSGFPKNATGSFTTSIASPSFSTDAADLLLVAVFAEAHPYGSGHTGNLSCSGHSLTWTSRVYRSSAGKEVRIWTAWASSTLSSGSVTVSTSQSGNIGCGALSVFAFSGSQSTVGNTSEGATATVSVSCSDNSMVVYGTADNGTSGIGAATGCVNDASLDLDDGESYWLATRAGHKTATTTAGNVTVGCSATSDPFTAALEVLAGATATTVNAGAVTVSVAVGASTANAHTIHDAGAVTVSVAIGAATAEVHTLISAAAVSVALTIGAVTVEVPGPTSVDAAAIQVAASVGDVATHAPAPLEADAVSVAVTIGAASATVPAPVTLEADAVSAGVAIGDVGVSLFTPTEVGADAARAAVNIGVVDVFNHRYFDNFNRANGALGGLWQAVPNSNMAVVFSNQAASAGGYDTGLYRSPISANQYSQISVSSGTAAGMALYVRQQEVSSPGYRCSFTYDDESGLWTAIIRKTTYNGFTNILTTGTFAAGTTYRLSVASQDAASSALLRLFVDGVEVGSVWDDTPLDSGYPGFMVGGSRGDNWAAGELPAPATPLTTGFPAGVATLSGSVGEPVPCTTGFPAGAMTSSGSVGEPTPCTTGFPAGALSMVGNANATVSRVKQTAVYPSYTAFGGTDSYTSQGKGQICEGTEASIGLRVGLGNDGVAGDRVLFHVDAANLIRADVPANPVYGAKLFVTALTCMNWDYLATGAAATPSGNMFRVRRVTADPQAGMEAMLEAVSGSEPVIEAKPIWLSGQTWYDSVVVGNPVTEFEVDITSLYNYSAQNGIDLDICLECVLSNTKWVAELVGNNPRMQWARPRIEVERWGTASVAITDTATCTPSVATTLSSGTLTSISWGYDEYPTPQGGCFKYLPGGEGVGTSSPYRLPMLESSTRVHVAIEVDYGAVGSQLFRRTFKTPQVFAPLLEDGANVEYPLWLDARGPVLGPTTGSNDAWYAIVKRDIPEWAATTSYAKGAVVQSSKTPYYAVTAGTSGSTGPVADGFWRAGTATVNAGASWTLYRATNYPGQEFEFVPHVGSVDATNVDTPDPLPYPSLEDNSFPYNGGDYVVFARYGMELEADDVGQPWFDATTGHIHFLSTLEGATGHEVRLNTIWFDSGGEVWWGINNWAAGATHVQGPIIYSATTQPDLKATGVVTRCLDWRHSVDHDPYAPFLVAFVANGYLRVFSNANLTKEENTDYDGGLPSGSWTSELTVAPDGVTDVRFIHLLTHEGAHHTAIAATGSGTGYANSRSNDVIAFTNGGGYSRTAGQWGTPATSSIVRAWATEVLPERSVSHGNKHIPDNHTAALALQLSDGTVRFYRPDMSAASGGTPALAPDADWSTDNTWNRHARCVSRWPYRTGYSAWSLGANGGMVSWGYDGDTIKANRVQDWLRVSSEKELMLESSVTALSVPKDMLLEGQRVPILTAHATGYHVSTVTVGVDPSRMHLPTADLRARFTSGRITVANFSQASRNQRLPSDITQLPGHNVFATGWPFDKDQLGAYIANPNGMMNEGGFNYIHLTGVAGERLKLLIHDTPTFGGKWRSGVLQPATDDAGYQAEALGGTTWMQIKMSTWWWTNDAPSVSPRRWYRVTDGMDYVLDGETQGGCYVVSLLSPGNNLWLAHDYVSDVDTWEGDVAYWLANNAAGLVKWVSATGELLTGTGASATVPMSQTTVTP